MSTPAPEPAPEPPPELEPGLGPEPGSTVERVAAELRRRVFEGELESGTPLREVGLAASLGVARSTVREALTVLVAEGLAVREPHRGVAVARPEAASVRDVCASRLVLEGAGVRAWLLADDARRERVRRSLAAYVDAIEAGGSYQQLNTLHLAFHVSLVGLTGSPRLEAMAEQLARELRLALAQVERINRNAHDQAETHVALVDLLRASESDGDLEPAHAFLEQHLADAEAEIIEALGLDDAP